VIKRVDAWAGDRVEAAIRRHYSRRLERLGKMTQLEPPDDGSLWNSGNLPPRAGCALEVLIDGEQALSAIAEAMADARSSVHVSGWHLSPGFQIVRGAAAIRLRDLLGDLAERIDVRVLLWAGAPLHAFTPDRREVRGVRDELTRHTRVKCALDGRERPMHCHHEKLVIIDGNVAFVGGIDLTSLGGDRFDTSDHPTRNRLGWHDVAARVVGPAVGDVARHFASRWQEITGESLDPPPIPAAGGKETVQVVRTVPEHLYRFAPQGDFGVLEAYIRALRSARTLVYLESQFLWSSQVVQILADKLRNPPTEDFRVVVTLPAKPNNGTDMTRGQLGVLADADRGEQRFLAATISARSGATTGPLYVHAKVGLVDDAWLTIGSANLNEHSLFNDTEVNLVSRERKLAQAVRLRLWAEHLERPIRDVHGEPARIVDELWRPIASEQLERRRRGAPATHRLVELPGVSRRSMALLGPVQGLLVDG
jgi:phosphatidylserine/phosphatidylglycerophosphate/cardiolipin synthase-like enzyme